jgi:hypothetical protein
MTKLYYDCPIKALYMMKEFEVDLQQFLYPDPLANERKLMHIGYNTLLSDLPYWKEEFKNKNRFYIESGSEHIFEPKHGDLNQDGDMFNSDINCSDPRGAWEEIGQNDSHKHDDRFDEIIRRESKHFFMAEVEE